LFSAKAAEYARHRPTYPGALFDWLASQVPVHELALDVGTGSGQAAVALERHFARVIGIDPSEGQLAEATPGARVEYRRAGADAFGLDPKSVDLVTAAQAFHWFPLEAFFREVERVVRPGGALAVFTYPLCEITPEIDAVVMELYEGHLGPHWEPERRLVEDGYRNVAVPFPEIAAPAFEMRLEWDVEDLIGYLGTWSPIRRYAAHHGMNPLEAIAPKARAAWGDEPVRSVRWPLHVRAFRVSVRDERA
jgi:SAM-dependent methyltransferase